MSTTVLHEQIADDLLAQLSDEDFSAWSDVRRRLPGDLQTQGQVLTSLFERGEVYCIKIAGRNYVKLPLPSVLPNLAGGQSLIERVLW